MPPGLRNGGAYRWSGVDRRTMHHLDKEGVYDYFVSARLPLEITYSWEAGTEPSWGAGASGRDREALRC